jgi:hypothetical protein
MSALKGITFYRAATLLLLFFCAGHTIGGILLHSSRGVEADAAFEAMKTVEFNLMAQPVPGTTSGSVSVSGHR